MASPKTPRSTQMNLSTKELEMLAAAWISLGDAAPQPDYDFMADFCNYTKGSASVLFGKVRRKLKAISDAEGTTTTAQTTTKTPKSSAKKRAAASTPKEEGTPTVKRGRKKKDLTEEAAYSMDAEDFDEGRTTAGVKPEPFAEDDVIADIKPEYFEVDDVNAYVYPPGSYGM